MAEKKACDDVWYIVGFTTVVSVIIVYVCIVHYVYAIALIIEPSAVGITAISALSYIFHSAVLTSGCFLIVASLAVLGLGYSNSIGMFLIAPQQAILIVSAYGAVEAMISGQFADGVVRPYWFLIADQSPTVAVALCHTFALIRVGRVRWNGR